VVAASRCSGNGVGGAANDGVKTHSDILEIGED
jgi:hypothetical protein